MTFDEIVDEVMEVLNLTSDAARLRVGKFVNRRYRRVLSAIGLDTSRRVSLDQVIDFSVAPYDTSLPNVEIPLTKIIRVQLMIDGVRPKLLDEMTFDEITEREPVDGNPSAWAVKLMDAVTTTITLDNFPTTEAFTLRMEGYVNVTNLEDDDVPAFPEDFHEILIEGAKADELRKMEKYPMAAESEQIYVSRLSDLQMFVAVSAYKDQQQAKNSTQWDWNWRYRRL